MNRRAALTIDESLRLRQVSDPQLSPDGTAVVYVVVELDEQGKEYRRNLWWVSAAGGEARPLTVDGSAKGEPRWSPDGSQIAFLAKRGDDEESQVWLLPAAGGEARRLTQVECGAHGLDWAPDGASLLFLSREPPGEEEKRLKEQGGVRIVDRFVRMHQVWTVDAASGHCRQLTRDRSSKSGARWSPDGRRIAFEQRRDPTCNQDYRASLWAMAASGRDRRRLCEGPGCDTAPRWSPDGGQVAFLHRAEARYHHINQLAVVPARGGRARVLTAGLDRSVVEAQWSSDGRRLYAVVHDGTRQHVHALAARGGRARPVTVFGLRVATRGGTLAFLSESATAPAEVHVADADGQGERTLTATNPQLGRVALGRTRLVRWRSPDGLAIEGILLLPPGHRRGRRVPLVVEPHGGPAGARGFLFHPTSQVLAGRGYAVLAPNFRGSAGYGQAFLDANADDFGGGDFADLMAGVDAMVEAGIADERRLAIIGSSYGGFMTSWAIGQTDRFRAAVAGMAVTNLTSFFGTTDLQWFTRGYQQGPPWVRAQRYAAQSPITYVGRVQTPTLIYHGDEDRRVPVEQGEQLYVSLRERGVPTELVRYPRAGHGLEEYWHRRDCLERIAGWLERWLKG